MFVRKGRKSDAPGCTKVMMSDGGMHFEKSDFEKAAAHKNAVFLVAEENKKVVGYILGFIVSTKKSQALIHETRVYDGKSGKKIGTGLVDEFCKTVFSSGVKKIFAEIEPRHLDFYKDSCKFKMSGKLIEVAKSNN